MDFYLVRSCQDADFQDVPIFLNLTFAIHPAGGELNFSLARRAINYEFIIIDSDWRGGLTKTRLVDCRVPSFAQSAGKNDGNLTHLIFSRLREFIMETVTDAFARNDWSTSGNVKVILKKVSGAGGARSIVSWAFRRSL